jgi:hypothetical protein
MPCLSRQFTLQHTPPIVRTEYLIGRYLVIFDSGKGCLCVCGEFRITRECRHTRESVGRRAAQELIQKRVRSIHGTLIGFSHHERRIDPRTSRRERSRCLALQRIR